MATGGRAHSLIGERRRSTTSEFEIRRREDADLFEQTVESKPMPYAKLVEENAFTPFVRR